MAPLLMGHARIEIRAISCQIFQIQFLSMFFLHHRYFEENRGELSLSDIYSTLHRWSVAEKMMLVSSPPFEETREINKRGNTRFGVGAPRKGKKKKKLTCNASHTRYTCDICKHKANESMSERGGR